MTDREVRHRPLMVSDILPRRLDAYAVKYGRLCNMLEAIYRDGPMAKLENPPRVTSKEARAHALAIFELLGIEP